MNVSGLAKILSHHLRRVVLRLKGSFQFSTDAGIRKKTIIVLTVLLFGVVVLHYRFRFCLAIGESMQPTLNSGDWLLVDKLAYQHNNPQRGDIVVGCNGNELLVKRIVGLPGEEVEIKAGLLYINGNLVPESHLFTSRLDFNISKGRMFAGKYATVGDNRAVPPSQTAHPIFSKNQIVGRVVFSFHLWN